MLRSKIGAFALLTALVLPLAASAQSSGAPPAAPAAHHHHHHGGAYMRALRGLQLSAAQKTQIHTMTKQARDAESASGPVDKATRHANTVALRQQIDGVLSDGQRAELHAKLRAQRQAKSDGTAPPQ